MVEADDFSRYDEAMDQSVSGQRIKVRILGGEHEGELHETETVFLDSPSDIKVKPGETIIVQTQEFPDGTFLASIFDRYRISWLIAFIILFLVLLVIIGGKQGLKAIISLLVSVGLIWSVEVGLDAVGIGQCELSEGLFPVGDDLAFDEPAGGLTRL